VADLHGPARQLEAVQLLQSLLGTLCVRKLEEEEEEDKKKKDNKKENKKKEKKDKKDKENKKKKDNKKEKDKKEKREEKVQEGKKVVRRILNGCRANVMNMMMMKSRCSPI